MTTKRLFVDGRWQDVRIRKQSGQPASQGSDEIKAAARFRAQRLAQIAARGTALTGTFRAIKPAKCSFCQKITDASKLKAGHCPECQSLQRTRALDQAQGKAIHCQCLDCRSLFFSADRGAEHCPKCARERRLAELAGTTYQRPLRLPRREQR